MPPDYDIYLGDIASLQGYRTSQFSRDSAPQVAPRFSTGSGGETDLDLLKSISVSSIAGGMFQREQEDTEKVARAVGVFNTYDKNLYPTPKMTEPTAFIGSPYVVTATAESDLYSYVAISYTATGTVNNKLYKILKDGTSFSQITLPSAIASGGDGVTSPITSLTLHKGYLFVSGLVATGDSRGTSIATVRMNVWDDSFNSIGSKSPRWTFSLRGVLYAINLVAEISQWAGESGGSVTETYLDTCGVNNPYIAPILDHPLEWNGAAWIGKTDGLFRFDGVKATRVLKLPVRYLTEYNGALYFYSGNWLYRFDGTNVEKVQYFGTAELITGMSSNSDNLFLVTKIINSNTYVDSDKGGTWTAGKAQYRMYAFNGSAFHMLDERINDYNTLQPWPWDAPFCVGNRVVFLRTDGAYNKVYYAKWDEIFTTAAVGTTSMLEATTSEFDDKYPNIFKAVEQLEVMYANMVAGDSIVVKYQTYDGKVWSAWNTAGTLTSTTENIIEITDNSKKLFKKIKVSAVATLTAASTLSLKGAAIRYTLQPRVRWRWQIGLNAFGNNMSQTRNGVSISVNSNALSNLIVKSIKQKTPIFLLAPDYGRIKTTVNSAATTFIVKGEIPVYTDPYSEYQLCAVLNASGVWEVLRVLSSTYSSGADETTIVVKERGYLGVTAASLNADAEFHPAYKVYITRLLKEGANLDETTINEQTDKLDSQIQRQFMLEVTEV